jgi:hypothetical protein
MMLSYDAAGAVAAPHGQCSSVGVMNAEAAADLLAAFRARGLRACVGGGWAVDALLDHQTGPHRDLDLAVDAAQLSEIMGFLAELGYSPAVDWLVWGALSSAMPLTPSQPARSPVSPSTASPPSSSSASVRGTPGVALIFMMSRSYGRCFGTVKTANPDDEDLSRSLVEHVGTGRRGANRRA